MKVFVTGVAGQLGYDLMNELNQRGYEAIGSDIGIEYQAIDDKDPVKSMPYVSLDITNKKKVDEVITDLNPDAVIHCAAWTNVDAAEEDKNKNKVMEINAKGTENIALACKNTKSSMVYISTDYIFDGEGETPWKADCTDYNPLNTYGLSKLKGEEAVRKLLDEYFIIRIAWVFGQNGNNFIKTMLNIGKTHDSLRVVDDQIGTPTYTYDLARLIVDMIETDKYGTYHATNEGGYISWYDFACQIFTKAGYDTKVEPVTTKEYGLSKAARPYNSRLDKSKLIENGFKVLPTWQDALERYLEFMEY